ncbi:c-type cytochrome [Shimia sp.]|uniref:c-type cytochrome n=1 Tax=Shimia sp. TaxID=1954381 RepID=UPI00356526B0
MGFLRGILLVLLLVPWPVAGHADNGADDRLVRLSAPAELVETGLLKHILPRFSLKHQIRVRLVGSGAPADMVLGDSGVALFQGLGRSWRMELTSPEHRGSRKLADWLTSEVGLRTVTGFAPGGAALFTAPEDSGATAVAQEFDGDPARGHAVARGQCARCHRVDDESRMSGIGSTPSFAVLRSLDDWQERFSGFYTLNPHPSFTTLTGVTPPFPGNRPPPIHPVVLTPEDLGAVLAYVAGMVPADLGAPLVHQ